MKRVFLFLMLCVLTFVGTNAQNVNADSNLLQRHHCHYMLGDVTMNQTEYMSFLHSNCLPAYQEFLSGYKLSQTGWAVFGCGMGLTTFGAILLVLNPKNSDGSIMHATGISFLVSGTSATWLVGIPSLCVGYRRMHNSVNTYNVMQKKDAYAYWSLQTSNNGVGIAYNF